jgi:hypothetical protein
MKRAQTPLRIHSEMTTGKRAGKGRPRIEDRAQTIEAKG